MPVLVPRHLAGRLRAVAAVLLLGCAAALALPQLAPRHAAAAHPAAVAAAAGHGRRPAGPAQVADSGRPVRVAAHPAGRLALARASHRAKAAATSTPAPVIRIRLHAGDTLWHLARRYGTTVASLQRLNHLCDSSLIYAGADFQVPAASGAPSAVPGATAVRAAARVRALPSSGSTGSLRHAATEVFGAQYRCAAAIITRESGWQVHALNPSSGAYGLAQALPGSKMAAAGPDWHDDGGTQLRWMRSYVNSRYGSACAAWAFWQAHSWY